MNAENARLFIVRAVDYTIKRVRTVMRVVIAGVVPTDWQRDRFQLEP